MSHKQVASAFMWWIIGTFLLGLMLTALDQSNQTHKYNQATQANRQTKASNMFWKALAGEDPVAEQDKGTMARIEALRILFDKKWQTPERKMWAIRSACRIASSRDSNGSITTWIELSTEPGYRSEKEFLADVNKAMSGDLTGLIRPLPNSDAQKIDSWSMWWADPPHVAVILGVLMAYIGFLVHVGSSNVQTPFTMLSLSYRAAPNSYHTDGNEKSWRIVCDILLAPFRLLCVPVILGRELVWYVNEDSRSVLIRLKAQHSTAKAKEKHPYKGTLQDLERAIKTCQASGDPVLRAHLPALEQKYRAVEALSPLDVTVCDEVVGVLAQADYIIGVAQQDGQGSSP